MVPGGHWPRGKPSHLNKFTFRPTLTVLSLHYKPQLLHQRTKVTCSQNSAVMGLDHQLMSFSQDPIGSAIRSANAITVWSGLIPRGQLIGQSSDTPGRGRGRRGLGCFCSVVQAFIDPLSNTAQHLVVVPEFPMGPVKITAGSPVLPPTFLACIHMVPLQNGEARSRASYIKRQTEVLQHIVCILY